MGNPDEAHYLIIFPIVHAPTGQVWGHGVGECSSDEDKYKWRRAVCQQEWDETDPGRRRMKWMRGKGGKAAYQVAQVRTQKADVANTVLKIAKKRSVADGALTATGGSRLFTQDIEDLPPELHGDTEERVQTQAAPTEQGIPTFPRGQMVGKTPQQADHGYLVWYAKNVQDGNPTLMAAVKAELQARKSGRPSQKSLQEGPSTTAKQKAPLHTSNTDATTWVMRCEEWEDKQADLYQAAKERLGIKRAQYLLGADRERFAREMEGKP